jgi:ketosteroid isomerase-like protein
MKNQKNLILEFNNCINKRDTEEISSLMNEDYVFIDSENNVEKGKQSGIVSWKGFFEHFPDYRNVFEKIIVKRDIVIVLGHSVCSNKMLNGKAIWTAKVKNDKIKEWRVYEDTLENRKKLKLS